MKSVRITLKEAECYRLLVDAKVALSTYYHRRHTRYPILKKYMRDQARILIPVCRKLAAAARKL